MNAPLFLLTRQDFDRPGRRLGVALACSLLVHLVLLLGIRVAPSAGPEDPRETTIAARLMEVALPPRAAVPEPVPMPVVDQSPVAAPVEPSPPAPPQPARPEPEIAAPSSPAPTPVAAVELPLAEDPTFYPAAQVDVHPRALRRIAPVFPDAAADAGIQGEVTLLLLIDEYGVVKEASVADAKPEGWFEESALEAFKSARFRPAERKGRAVKSRVLIRVSYELGGNGSAGPQRSPSRTLP